MGDPAVDGAIDGDRSRADSLDDGAHAVRV